MQVLDYNQLKLEDESVYENYDGGSVSIYTLKNFLTTNMPYISLNLMI